MIAHAELNLPHVRAEVEAVFAHYEAALMDNDLSALDAHFWHSEGVVRYGMVENLYGIEAIRAFRLARDASDLARALHNTRITTFGEDAACTSTEFSRPGQPSGRQTQMWIRFPEGWRIVAAHVSLLPAQT